MNIEKTLTTVILALGIVGSAALAAGGKAGPTDLDIATVAAVADEGVNAGLFTVHAFDSHDAFFGI